MKQSVYSYIRKRIRILGINIVNTFNIETAYPAENWANLFSTAFYTLSYLLFLEVIFGNVKTLAGYSKNDMLFFTVLGQAAFYTMYTWSYDNLQNLIESVHKGELDLLLTKPIPTLFYVSTRTFTVIRLVRDSLIPLIMIAILVDWPALHLTFWHVVAGLVIFALGQWVVHVLQFLLVLPAFWNGQSQALLRLSYTLTGPDIPLEGLPRFWKVFLTTLLPVCVPVAMAVSVMLGRSDARTAIIWVVTLAIVASVVRIQAWKKALSVYNSASS